MNNPFDQFDQQPTQQQAVPPVQGGQQAVAGNPFDQFDSNTQQAAAPTQQQQQAPVQQPTDDGAFFAGVEAMNRQFGRMAEGVLDLVTWGKANQAVNQVAQANDAALAQTAQLHPTAVKVGNVVGAITSAGAYGSLYSAGAGVAGVGTGLTATGTAIGNAIKAHPITAMIAGGAANGATMGYLNNMGDQTQRLENAGIGGLLGGGLTAGYQVAKKGINALLKPAGEASISKQMFRPNAAAEQNAAFNLKAGGETPESLQASIQPAIATGGNIPTIAQATDNIVMKKVENNLAIPNSQIPDAYAKVNAQEATVTTGLNKAIANMAPEGAPQEVHNFYTNELPKLTVPQETVDALKANNIIAQHLDDVNKMDTRAMQSLPETSMAKLDAVKKNIDYRIYNDTFGNGKDYKALSASSLNGLKDASAQIKETLDQIHPQYKDIRSLAQKTLLQNKLKDLFGLVKTDSKGVASVDSLSTRLFNKPDKINDFLDAIKQSSSNPEQDVAYANNVITLAKQYQNSPLKKILVNEEKGTGVSSTNKIGMVQNFVNNLFGRNYDRAVFNLITDPKWVDRVSAVMQQQGGRAGEQSWLGLVKDVAKETFKQTPRAVKNAAIMGTERLLNPTQPTQQNKGYLSR